MKELLEKISSYNIFNYLFPGVLFAALSEQITHYSFLQENLIIGAFVYYFIGLVISRFGSLVIEWTLKKIKIVKFTDYEKFIFASEKDPKIEVLSETNNMYRTLMSLFIFLLLLKLYELVELQLIEMQFPFLEVLTSCIPCVLLILLFLMFLFAYRKQTNYIFERVNTRIEAKED